MGGYPSLLSFFIIIILFLFIYGNIKKISKDIKKYILCWKSNADTETSNFRSGYRIYGSVWGSDERILLKFEESIYQKSIVLSEPPGTTPLNQRAGGA